MDVVLLGGDDGTMRNCVFAFWMAGFCLGAEERPVPVLVLKSGQRIVYDELSREEGTYFVRTGGQLVMIDAGEVAPAPVVVPAKGVVVGKGVPERVARLIGPNAGRHNLRPELIQAVMEVESGYQVGAKSRGGAIGLMQLMPQTAKHLKVNAHEPGENVEGGARLLDYLMKKYESRKNGLALALAAYNAGDGAVDRFGGIPPYKETRQYVVKVMKRFRELVKD